MGAGSDSTAATPGTGGTWQLERRTGTAQELHDAPVPAGTRLVRINEVTDRALVLGSTQSVDTVSPEAMAAHGLDLARRRSGGGAVLLVPDGQVWVDVVVPVGDDLWEDDVETSSWWLGRSWAAAIAAWSVASAPGSPAGTGVGAEVHRGGVTDRELARIACFAALGPGEVSVHGQKLVGISQRRTRELARFQCVVHLHWDAATLLATLDAGDLVDRLEHALIERACGLDDVVPTGEAPSRPTAGWSVVEELVAHLP